MRRSIHTLFLLCLLSWGIQLLFAQSTNTGIVAGTVTDPSGALVSDAMVTLTDVSTGSSRTASTNSAGHYIFVNVPPGKYNTTFSKQGFSTTKASLDVQVGQTTTFDMALQVGGSSVVVEVTAATNELQTMNATIGNTVTSQALSSLPTLGRDTSSFVTMQPGVSPDGSAGGTVVDQAVFMLDGGNNSNDMDGSSGVYNPNFGDDPAGGLFSNKNNQISGANLGINGGQPSGVMPTPVDSVEEFKVATTNQTADFNNSSGLQVQIVTKRGTSAWHGTGYEYYLDNNFSANTWDNNQATPKIPVPDWHRNWFGGAVGGPIIPKEILGGKTYAFFNYQGARWPNSETITRLTPGVDMRNGILHDLTNPAITYNLNTLDPRGIGINSYVQQLWNKYMPLPTPGAGCGSLAGNGYCDNVNTFAFRANLSLPQNDNFGVVRLDHDFGEKWHFQASYRYYHLTRATDDQVDIGGFFPGDTLGTPASLTNRPQVPWYLVLGMTTNVNTHVTNDFRYSYLRNWWQWGSHGDPAQFSNLGAALEPFGESANNIVAAPYNVNNQNTRTRFWNGRDNFLRDDVSWLKGNHLFQFGGQYQHNWNYHSRTDNGGTINYYPVYQIGDSAGAGTVTDMTALGSAFSNTTLAREAAAVLGIVTDTQQVYTYSVSGSNLLINPPLTPAFDKVTIPYYNLYMNDTWRIKPSLTFTYGLGWALEMPPTEQDGKQILLVDSTGRQINTQSYLQQRQQAALQGLVYNPQIGFGLIDSVTGHPSHIYDPFYGAFSPRIAIAWNPDLGNSLGGKATVFRGGYGRIYGRLNGVGLVLTPLLSPGLIYPASCPSVFRGGPNGSCGTVGPTLNTAFRIGTDGTSPVIPVPANTVTQPSFPGAFGNATAATAAPLDPKTRPNSVDSFDLTIQHQFSSKILVEFGGISRWIHNTLQSINLNSVPYMMTLGGQQFQAAYANLEKAMGCATSIADCNAATAGMTVAPQPFFEKALAGTGFPCTPSCTQGLVNQKALFADLQGQQVYSLWTALDHGGTAPGFNFPASTLAGSGQISGNVLSNTSLGHGNYNAAFATFKFNDWHGITLQNNLTFSRALGTGDVIQATSEQGVVDPFNLNTQYGVQPSDRKLVESMFLVWQEPFYRGQQGIEGHLLGGWTPSFVFAAGSGAPLFCASPVSFVEEGYSGSEEFGSGDGATAFTDANCVLGGGPPAASFHKVDGIYTAFADPTAVTARIRPLILGYDTRSSGYGAFRGLKYWNLNFGVKKNIRITERFNAEASLNVNNILNHNQLLDPILLDQSTPANFGQFSIEGTTPRTMEMGIRFNF
jgi:Carboxypeptidase regulatory-like domain